MNKQVFHKQSSRPSVLNDDEAHHKQSSRPSVLNDDEAHQIIGGDLIATHLQAPASRERKRSRNEAEAPPGGERLSVKLFDL